MRPDFAVFITSHERARETTTAKALREHGYSGRIYTVIDDWDSDLEQYRELHPDVIVFSKPEWMERTKCLTNTGFSRSVVYARNFVEHQAVRLGLSYFLMIDDDITKFTERYEAAGRLASRPLSDFDALVDEYVRFLGTTGVACVSLGAMGSYIGGLSAFFDEPKRRCCGAFFRNASVEIDWRGEMNEDYITSILEGVSGKLFLELKFVQIQTTAIGKSAKGGLVEAYKRFDGYSRTFLAVLSNPSCVAVKCWRGDCVITCATNNAYPKVISGRWKREI